MQITVPTAATHATAWRKTVTMLTTVNGDGRVEGTFLRAGDLIDAPVGTLVLAIDKVTTGYEYTYHGCERIAVQDATVAVHLVAQDGLKQTWSRHYTRARSAFGATTMKKLATLLAQHPAPSGEIRVLAEARRPNSYDGQCRWCHAPISAGLGHWVGHGGLEHFQQCPTRCVASGTPCALCGVSVTVGRTDVPAVQVLVREGAGRWETRHAEQVGCVTNPPESHEDYTTRLTAARQTADAAHAERLRKQREADERRSRKATERQAAAQANESAEIARVAGLEQTGRSAVTLNDKSLGDGLRVALDEVTIALSDRTTTTRWVTRTYRAGSGQTGEDNPDQDNTSEYTSKAAAQAAYQALKFKPAASERDTDGRTCDECGRSGARFSRQDSSGIHGVVCARCDRCADYELSFA